MYVLARIIEYARMKTYSSGLSETGALMDEVRKPSKSEMWIPAGESTTKGGYAAMLEDHLSEICPTMNVVGAEKKSDIWLERM